MAVDNPSYFSLSGGGPSSPSRVERCTKNSIVTTLGQTVGSSTTGNPRTFAAFFRKRPICGNSTTVSPGSGTSLTTTTIADNDRENNCRSNVTTMTEIGSTTCNEKKKSFRSLFRSMSANAENEKTRQILKGDPRPSDVAPPSPYLPHRSHSHSERDRRRPGGRRRTLKSASESLSNDMIYCGLPGEGGSNAIDRNLRTIGNVDVTDRDRNDDDDDDDDDDGDADNAEVFLGIDDARYYNVSSIVTSLGRDSATARRHSIGTFVGNNQRNNVVANSAVCNFTTFSINPSRLRVQTTGFIKEPDSIAPPIPTDFDEVDGGDTDDGNVVRSGRRCRRHRSGSGRGSRGRPIAAPTKPETPNERVPDDRDDVIFVSSKDSEVSSLWVNYLTACFEQISRQQGRPPFRVRHVTVEDAAATCSSLRDNNVGNARLQIVVVCPGLLDRVATRPENAANLARQLSPERVLAMMLGVHDGHLNDSHRSALVNYTLWRKFFVKDQDETFVGEFLGAAVAILGTTTPSALRSDKTTFSVHPKKVKMGQNRIMAILNEPLNPEDVVAVVVDRCGEAMDITHVKRRNPYVLQFSIPDKCLEVSMLVGVRIMINGSPQGVRQVKCESRLRELDQILRAHDNPLEFMCQTFGFNSGDRDQLDNWMVTAFQKNLPPRFDLLSNPTGSPPLQRNQTSPEENPTLLHFAARFGLEKLAWQLLECPGGDVACDLKNVAELTPADLADQAGHARLAHQLRGYMQMNEFTNMYSYLKVISESTSHPGTDNESAPPISSASSTYNENENDKEDYCRPRPLSEAYSVPPAARPITVSSSMTFVGPPQLPPPNPTISPNPCETNYSVLPPPTPIHGPTPTAASNAVANGLDMPLQGYLKMHAAGPKMGQSPATTCSNNPLTASTTSLRSQTANQSSSRAEITMAKREDGASTPTSNCASGFSITTSINGGKSREPTGPHDELLEIINDFKNNVFTISEVERLVDNWRNRNDVQQSFKDKQRQLAAMRDEYERIQKRIKDEMKAPTPFDRIKKFFTKGKKELKTSSVQGEDGASTSIKPESSSGNLSDRRPISSLSLHSVSSSSSSGRMSIISGCSGTSLGDSGTHSDPEDRRAPRPSRDDKGGVMNYEIPPAPKPFTGRYSPMRYTPSPRSSATSNDTDQRRRASGPQPGDADYYIAFPVSGLPVHSFQPNGTPMEPKTPISPSDAPVYLDLTDKVNGIPELSETTDDPSSLAEASSSSSSSSSRTPMPPGPPAMHVPMDYVNVTKVVRTSTEDERSTTSDDRPKNLTSPIIDESTTIHPHSQKQISSTKNNETKNFPNDNDEDVNNEIVEISTEYVDSDVIDDNKNLTCVDDGNDSPRLPEYMNIGVTSEEEIAKIVGVVPKKMAAPPVPPRGDSSLNR